MTLAIENFRLFCCVANSLEDGCLPRIGAANNKDAKTPSEPSNILCLSQLSFYNLFSLEFGIGKRHLLLGCLRWWKWWRIKISIRAMTVWLCWVSHRSDVTDSFPYLLQIQFPAVQLYYLSLAPQPSSSSLNLPMTIVKACKFVARSLNSEGDKLQINFPQSLLQCSFEWPFELQQWRELATSVSSAAGFLPRYHFPSLTT